MIATTFSPQGSRREVRHGTATTASRSTAEIVGFHLDENLYWVAELAWWRLPYSENNSACQCGTRRKIGVWKGSHPSTRSRSKASLAAAFAFFPARSIISTSPFVSITSARALNGPSEIVKVNVADASGQPLRARSRFEHRSSMFKLIFCTSLVPKNQQSGLGRIQLQHSSVDILRGRLLNSIRGPIWRSLTLPLC